MSEEQFKANKPEKQYRSRNLSVSVFPKGDKKGPNVVVQKGFRKKGSDVWTNETLRLFPEEIDSLIGVLREYKQNEVVVEQKTL